MSQSVEITDTVRKMWREMTPGIEDGIRSCRQESFRLQIRDINGNRVPRAKVWAVQKTHDFDFGCNCLWLGQCGGENETYERRIAELFNLVTTTFCLSDIQPEEGTWRFEEDSPEVFRRPPVDRVVRFAKQYGLRLKGQPLLAGSWYPAWAAGKRLGNDAIKELYTDYFRRVAERYGKVFDQFDLVNEALLHTSFPLYTKNLDYVVWAFKTARSIFPSRVKLSLNEATGWGFDEKAGDGKNQYFNLIRRLLDCGVKPDSIGFQFHLWNAVEGVIRGEGRYTLEEIRDRLREFSEFGIPMYITEITIPSVISGIRCESIQAEVLEQFYRLFFSIPNLCGILQWNLCDGRAWKSEGDCCGGIVDEFLRKKPSYLALEHLLNREWKTAVEMEADENGTLEFRGFRGEYDLTIETDGRKRTLPLQRLNSSAVNEFILV